MKILQVNNVLVVGLKVREFYLSMDAVTTDLSGMSASFVVEYRGMA